jgi:hypothetical protein
MEHVRVLAGQIGQRQVSTRGLGRAKEYLHHQLLALQRRAAASPGGVLVEVDVQDVSGAVNMDFCQEVRCRVMAATELRATLMMRRTHRSVGHMHSYQLNR